MRQIVPNVYMMENLSVSNVYLIVSSRGLFLVDSGLPGEADQIVDQMQEKAYALSDLRIIVLTHAHGDHAGNAAALAARSGAQVLAHVNEPSYVEQDESTMSTTPARSCQVDRILQDGDVIEALGGLRVIHSPGHTSGSICLYRPERQILFCGDVLIL
jgi:glyoxylase-like metal-dependent hydrolase (beta-lactamase superfamily II)